MFTRALRLPADETLFLWGPRQTGKSTLLRQQFPESLWVDLLLADEFRRYTARPELLRERLAAYEVPPHVVIDEIQQVPQLLDEVHWLHENRRVRFALSGSSARKVRRGGHNLPGGRALRLFGLVSQELGSDFDLVRLLNHGYLPRHYGLSRPRRALAAYVSDYLRQEVAAEGLTRRLPAFSDFLDAAALSDTEPVAYTTIARDCGVSSPTVKSWYEVLDDTLLGRWLPAWRKRPKRRTGAAPKWYFADVGVAGFLARRGQVEPGSAAFGKAFENWVCHELSAYDAYAARLEPLSYWRLTTGAEVDFVVGDMALAVEAKATERVVARHLKGLRELAVDHPEVRRRCVVCLEPQRRVTEDGIEVWPYGEFAAELWAGGMF